MALPTTLIRITPPTLRTGYCYPASPQTFINDIFAAVQAVFTTDIGNSFFNFGDTTPAPENRIYPWLKTDGHWYTWSGGYWISRHPYAANDYVRLMWVGTTDQLKTFDGGSDAAVTENTGPMWEVDTAFEAKFPVGVGTFAAAGGIAVQGSTTTLGVTGEDQHTLTEPELALHNHHISTTVQFAPGATHDTDAGGGSQFAVLDTDDAGGDVAHNNLPPMYGVYIIKRTARVNYTA